MLGSIKKIMYLLMSPQTLKNSIHQMVKEEKNYSKIYIDHQSFRKLNFEQAREKLLLENDINLRPISDSTLSDTKQSSVLMPFGCTLKYFGKQFIYL